MNTTQDRAEWHLSDLQQREDALVQEMLDLHPQMIEFKHRVATEHVLVKSSRDVWERKVKRLAELREEIVQAKVRVDQVSKASHQSDELKVFLAHVAGSADSGHVIWRLDMLNHKITAKVLVLKGADGDAEWVEAETPLHAVDYHASHHFLHDDRTFSQIGLEDFHLSEADTYAIVCGCDFDFDDDDGTPSTMLERWVMRQAILQRIKISESAQAHAACPPELVDLIARAQS